MSIELKLKAENGTEERVLKYLQENASAMLAEKINTGTKTLAGAMDYAKDEAHKLARGARYACVEDQTVFGWIIHFFEEDDIKEHEKQKQVQKVRTLAPQKKQPVKKVEPKKEVQPANEDGQLMLFQELFK